MIRTFTNSNFADSLFSESAKRFFHTKSLMLVLGLWLGLMANAYGQATLAVGDIAIIGVNMDGPRFSKFHGQWIIYLQPVSTGVVTR